MPFTAIDALVEIWELKEKNKDTSQPCKLNFKAPNDPLLIFRGIEKLQDIFYEMLIAYANLYLTVEYVERIL